jgi:hypothetical protein
MNVRDCAAMPASDESVHDGCVNIEWVLNELRTFVDRCEALDDAVEMFSPATVALRNDVDARTPIVIRTLDTAWPEWRAHLVPDTSGWRHRPLRDIAKQAILWVQRVNEIEENLGPRGPSVSAASLHPKVWEAALSLWDSGHYGDAVDAAARSVNAFLQNKVGRRDVADQGLVAESFSLTSPEAGRPRLRLMDDDGSPTYKSVHEGAIALGRGCFMTIRNVLAHEFGQLAEPPEHVALEYLAAFSVLARWIDSAEVVSV